MSQISSVNHGSTDIWHFIDFIFPLTLNKWRTDWRDFHGVPEQDRSSWSDVSDGFKCQFSLIINHGVLTGAACLRPQRARHHLPEINAHWWWLDSIKADKLINWHMSILSPLHSPTQTTLLTNSRGSLHTHTPMIWALVENTDCSSDYTHIHA